MAVDGINISLNEVSATANTLRTLNTTLASDLTSIKTEINNLSSSWQSDGADTIQAKINGMQTTFENYQKVIDSYAKFLDETVSSYQTAESSVNANASAFQ